MLPRHTVTQTAVVKFTVTPFASLPRASAAMEITFTGVSPAALALQKRIVRLAATEASSRLSPGICVSGGTTPKRTLKLLFAAARGMWVVSEEWVFEHGARAKALVDPAPFERNELMLRGARIARAAGCGVALKGFQIAVVGPTALPHESLCNLLHDAGGEVVEWDGARCDSGLPLLIRPLGTSCWQPQTEAALLASIMSGVYEEEIPAAAATSLDGQTDGKAEVRIAAESENQPPSSASRTRSSGVGRKHAGLQPVGPSPGRERCTGNIVSEERGGGGDSFEEPVEGARCNVETTREPVGRAKRRRVSAAPQDAQVEPLPLADDEPPAGVRGLMLPPHSQKAEGTVSAGESGAYFLMQDALRLYRQRLPDCNVLLVQARVLPLAPCMRRALHASRRVDAGG